MTVKPKNTHTTDLLIVGGGPAGLSAATAAASTGMQVAIIDESPTLGGRLLGQIHQSNNSESKWWNGTAVANQLLKSAEKESVQFFPETAVWSVDSGFSAFGTYRNTTHVWNCKRVLLATGAAERPVPIPGWQLPGVMSIGGAQIVANVHKVKPGRRAIIVGINSLSVVIARSLAMAGVEIVGVVLPAKSPMAGTRACPLNAVGELLSLTHLAHSPLTRFAGSRIQTFGLQRLATHLFPRKGISMWGIPIQPNHAALRIEGDNKVETVVVANISPSGEPIPDSARNVDVDLVCISGGLYPLIELANSVGCAVAFSKDLGGHVPVYSSYYETTIKGIFATGNMIGIEGAEVAIAQGKAAGLSIAYTVSGDPLLRKLYSKAEEELNHVRKRANFRFMPNITRGRNKMKILLNEQFNTFGTPQ